MSDVLTVSNRLARLIRSPDPLPELQILQFLAGEECGSSFGDVRFLYACSARTLVRLKHRKGLLEGTDEVLLEAKRSLEAAFESDARMSELEEGNRS